MIASVLIRPASLADAEQITSLLAELGYPSEPDAVVSRLGRLNNDDKVLVLVAEEAGPVVGLVTCHLLNAIHTTPTVAWITTLVVRTDHQRSGVGGQLVTRAEEWAHLRGAVRLSVSSGTHRANAHEFYQRAGYAVSGVRLTKSLE